MRRAPINYLVSWTVIGGLWVVAAILVGNYIGDNAALSNVTPEDFGRVYKVVMTIVAVAGALALAHWYWQGAKDVSAADVGASRRFWSIWLFILAVASVAAVAGLAVTFRSERFTLVEYLLIFGCASLLTWIPYWLCSLVMSPRGVKHAPFGMA